MTRSLDDVVDGIGHGPAQYLLALFCGELLSGLVKMLMAVGVHDHVTHLGFTGVQRAMVFAAIFVGNGGGNLLSGYLGDWFGRRSAMLIGNALIAAGLLVLFGGGTKAFELFVLCNVAVGLGVGLMGPACWTLIGESSATADRTYFSGFGHVAWCAGSGLVVASMLARQDTILLVGCASLLAWAHLFGVFLFVVESPTFHAARGDRAKAIESLEALRKRNGASVDTQDWTFGEKVDKVSYSALLTAGRQTRVAALSCCFVCAVVNFSHYGLLYTVPMLISDAAYGALLTVLMSLVANVFALTCAHRISRRALMLGALIVSTVLVFPLLFDKESIAYLLTLAAQFAAIFLAFFGVYLYVVEVVAAPSRASAAGLAMTCGRAAAAASPFVREGLGTEGFLMSMCVMQAVAVGIVAALQIEPNLRQLSEITGETARLSGKAT